MNMEIIKIAYTISSVVLLQENQFSKHYCDYVACLMSEVNLSENTLHTDTISMCWHEELFSRKPVSEATKLN